MKSTALVIPLMGISRNTPRRTQQELSLPTITHEYEPIQIPRARRERRAKSLSRDEREVSPQGGRRGVPLPHRAVRFCPGRAEADRRRRFGGGPSAKRTPPRALLRLRETPDGGTLRDSRPREVRREARALHELGHRRAPCCHGRRGCGPRQGGHLPGHGISRHKPGGGAHRRHAGVLRRGRVPATRSFEARGPHHPAHRGGGSHAPLGGRVRPCPGNRDRAPPRDQGHRGLRPVTGSELPGQARRLDRGHRVLQHLQLQDHRGWGGGHGRHERRPTLRPPLAVRRGRRAVAPGSLCVRPLPG